MATTAPERGTKITVDLGDRNLFRRLRVAAAENDTSVRQIVIEAVRYWLGHQEEIEDDLAAALIERRDAGPGGEELSHDEVMRRVGRR